MRKTWLVTLAFLSLIPFGTPYLVRAQSADSLRDIVHIANELVTIPNGRHGGFTDAENLRAYTAIRAFLAAHSLPIPAAGEAARSSASR